MAQDRCGCRTVCVCFVVIFSGLAVHARQQRLFKKNFGTKGGKGPRPCSPFFPQLPVPQDRRGCRTVCICFVVIFNGLAVHARQQRLFKKKSFGTKGGQGPRPCSPLFPLLIIRQEKHCGKVAPEVFASDMAAFESSRCIGIAKAAISEA